MSADANAAVGPGMDPDEEAQHRRNLARVYADEADQAVEQIEAKLEGMRESLKVAKAEAKRLRAQVEER